MSPSLPLSVEHCRYGIRETTEGIKLLIPELCLVGHVRYHTARPASFFNHRHSRVLEIFYVVHGKVTWWVEGVSTEVCGNELFLIWPDEWHGARDNIVEPAEYYWIQVRLPQLRRSAGDSSLALRAGPAHSARTQVGRHQSDPASLPVVTPGTCLQRTLRGNSSARDAPPPSVHRSALLENAKNTAAGRSLQAGADRPRDTLDETERG